MRSVASREGCFRCGGVLANPGTGPTPSNGIITTTKPVAYLAAAIPLFVAAQCFPLMLLEGRGQRVAVTIGGAAQALWVQGLWVPAAVVLLTTLLLPAVRLLGVGYLLLCRQREPLPATAASILHALQLLRPWNQMEVLLFGILVAFGKLAADFRMTPAAGLPCMVAVLLLERWAAGYVDGRRYWVGVVHPDIASAVPGNARATATATVPSFLSRVA
ncbi:MAG: paraquat-inducible protein A [Polyangia bacterium]